MKKVKKLLGFLLCLCILTAMIAPVTAQAASQVNIFNITVTAPKTGEKPSNKGSVPATASTTVTKVEWEGSFAADGTFAAGQAYTVKVTCTIKSGQNKVIKYIDKKAKINENYASLVSTSKDQQSIVLKYTFPKTSGTAQTATPAPAKEASPINIFNITVTAPKIGEKPSTKGSVPSTASTTVTNVKWEGTFAADGTFAEGQAYTVKVTCTLKSGQNKYIKFVKNDAKINENYASLVSISDDQKSITLTYTFPKTQKVTPTATEVIRTTLKDLSFNDYEWEVLRLTNVERAKQGLDLLSMIQPLQEACDVREREIITLFSHDRPDGSSCFTAFPSTFKTSHKGENIAKGQKNPEKVINDWMNSEGHRANILSKNYGYLSVGYNSDGNGWVQLFANRKLITNIKVSTSKTALTESEIREHYLTITTNDGYVSYLPLDFNSMTKNSDGTYSPALSADNTIVLPAFTKLSESNSGTNNQTANKPATGNNTVNNNGNNSNNNNNNTTTTSGEIVKVNTIKDLSLNDYEWELLRLVNIERRQHGGLFLLTMPQELQTACDTREPEIVTLYSHDRPDGSSCFTAIPSTIRISDKGEDIAIKQKTPADAMAYWKLSPDYGDTILSSKFGYLGVGYTSNSNGWVAMYTDRRNMIKVEASTAETAFTESEIKKHYLRITASDGTISYLPLDFNSMITTDDGLLYTPNLPISGLPYYTKLEEGTTSGNNSQPSDKLVVLIENQYLTETRDAILEAIKKETDKSKFTKNGLLNIARAVAKTGTTVNWSKYDETPATTTKEGKITGTLTLNFGQDSLTVDITTATPKLPDTGTSASMLERYIPIENVYGAYISDLFGLKKGDAYTFQLGTQFVDETNASVMFNPLIKRNKYQGGYVKINYIGTYESVGENIRNKQLCIFNASENKSLLAGTAADYIKKYNITKDTAVISVDLYDANKKFVQTISPACVILATGKDGDFLTFSKYGGRICSLYFSNQDNIFPADADKNMQSQIMHFDMANIMVDDKDTVAALLPQQTGPQKEYEFVQYPELTGTPIYNANLILSDEEFISPENIYYQVTYVDIDPVIMNKIENVISYSMYKNTISVGYYQRNIVGGDGTLYGITSKDECLEIAKNVKKTGAYHYLTNDGVLKELNGKVVTTNCVDFAESYDFKVLGVLKDDGCLYLGYSYYAGGAEYEKGLSKKLSNVTHVFPSGAYTKDKHFYRWNETVTVDGYDEKAFARGEFIVKNTFKLSVIHIASNVERVFPYEYLTKIWAGQTKYMDENITSFVQTKSGELVGYGLRYHESFGIYDGKIERIFPMFQSYEDGNFVGIKVEGDSTVHSIAARFCDQNKYRKGKIFAVRENGPEYFPKYVCETLDGFLAADGAVFTIADYPKIIIDYKIEAIGNKRGNLGQMHRSLQTYMAFNSTTLETIPLLPSVCTWYFDEHQIVLLERTDGSMWASSFLPKTSAANLSAKVGGYENSNVVQISGPQTKKVNAEFITLD